MKDLQTLSAHSPQQLQEMLAEAERALHLLGTNPKTPLKVISSYQLDGDEILTLESSLPHALVAGELRRMITQLKSHLQLP